MDGEPGGSGRAGFRLAIAGALGYSGAYEMPVYPALTGPAFRPRTGADTLYGTQAPKDAAFLRVFRAVEGGGPVEVARGVSILPGAG